MKITKSRLREIIKEELDTHRPLEEKTLDESLIEDVVGRLMAFGKTLPPEENNELQDVLATIAQLDPQNAHDAIKAASSATISALPKSPPTPGIKYTESIEENKK